MLMLICSKGQNRKTHLALEENIMVHMVKFLLYEILARSCNWSAALISFFNRDNNMLIKTCDERLVLFSN